MSHEPVDYKFYLTAKIIDLLKDILKYVTYIAAFYFASDIAAVWAGKKTEASIAFSYLTSSENDYGLPWLLTLLSLLYGFSQRSLRLRKTQYFQKHILELESKIDPQRTSSGLLPTGETHPGDKLL